MDIASIVFGMIYALLFSLFLIVYKVDIGTWGFIMWSTVLGVGALAIKDFSEWSCKDDHDNKRTKD